MFDPVQRENKIFSILQELVKANLRFVIVGGYAVSAYKHRFSVDADIVLKKEDQEQFEELLRKNGLMKTIVKELEHLYAPEFVRYETREEPAVSIDLLINGIGSRTTNTSFSLEQLEAHARKRIIFGTEKEVTALVPDREVLIALKIHSGRLTDLRDIAALCKNINLDTVQEFLTVGDQQIIRQNIKKLLTLLEQKGFRDSFKGVFREKKYDLQLPEIQKLQKFIEI
ncbi:MAG: nucleotidyl transferase AbiEii/AbiGii toxin family protein [Nanoarchaeota archaeon]